MSAVVIVVYCTLGGFLAASTTGFVQSNVMTIGGKNKLKAEVKA